MLIDHLAEEVCVPHFTGMVRGENNWYRVGHGLAGYTDQVTKKVAQAVCQTDSTCALKSLPGAPSYNLAYLKESMEDLANLTLWDYL